MALSDPTHAKPLAMALGPVLAALVGLATWGTGASAAAGWTAAITTLCATWWVTEPIPVPATSISNAIVYGTGQVATAEMARRGAALNVVGAVVLTGLCSYCFGS